MAAHEKKNYDRAELKLPKGRKAAIAAHASALGESVNGFIGRAILETMERDNGGTASSSPQEAAAVAAGSGAVSLPPDVLEAVQRAAHAAEEAPADFIRRATAIQAHIDRAGITNMILLSPDMIQDATAGGFAVGETARQFIERAVRDLLERERPNWDDETLNFREAQRMAV